MQLYATYESGISFQGKSYTLYIRLRIWTSAKGKLTLWLVRSDSPQSAEAGSKAFSLREFYGPSGSVLGFLTNLLCSGIVYGIVGL
jgi:hypothetical protein